MDRHEHPPAPIAPSARFELGVVALLMLCVLGLRGWQVAHTAVVSRDGVAFIQYAWRLDHQPWAEVIRSSPRHPGFPATVWGLATLTRPFCPDTESLFMQHAAQWASALASVFLVIPVYLLARSWFGAGVAVAAVILAQLVPAGGIVLGDGLSEATFLLLAMTALLAADRGFETGSAWSFALCGFASGLAYLVRPEGLLIAGATGLVLLCLQVSRTRRQTLGRFLTLSTCLVVALVAAASPLVIVTGKLTPKPTAQLLADVVADTDETEAAPPAPAELAVSIPLAHAAAQAQQPADQDPRTCIPSLLSKLAGTAGAMTHDLMHGLLFYLWAPVLLGACFFQGWRRPGCWVFAIVALLILGLLGAVHWWAGYVSDRHMILVLLGAAFAAALGLVETGRRLAARWHANPTYLSLALVALAAAPLLVRGCLPIHHERSGYRQAGLWLAAHAQPHDIIVDPHTWSSYYAGRAFAHALPTDNSVPPTVYVVLDRANAHHSRLPAMPGACVLADRGQVVYQAPALRWKKRHVQVEVFALTLDAARAGL